LPYHPSIDLSKQVTAWAIAYYVVEVTAAILAIAVVYSVDRNQQATHELIAAKQPGPLAMGQTE
jgi:hypothetical protein